MTIELVCNDYYLTLKTMSPESDIEQKSKSIYICSIISGKLKREFHNFICLYVEFRISY